MSDATIRGQIATSLERIAQILQSNQIVNDISPLYKAAGQCRNYMEQNLWGYELNNLIFRGTEGLKSIPNEVEDIAIELSISIEGYCEIDDNLDPLIHLAFQLLIYGNHLVSNENGAPQIKQVICSWHLDKHIVGGENGIPEFIHPSYHFQCGGRYIKNAIDDNGNPLDFGSALFLDSPRIPHPPLDAILGVDFIISNFISSTELAFREEGNYVNVLRPIQAKIWKPYIEVLSANWQANAHILPWTPSTIWPRLLLPD